MEISVAVVRMRSRVNGCGRIEVDGFDVLLVNEPSSSSRHDVCMQLPRCRVPPNGGPTEMALSFVHRHCRYFLYLPAVTSELRHLLAGQENTAPHFVQNICGANQYKLDQQVEKSCSDDRCLRTEGPGITVPRRLLVTLEIVHNESPCDSGPEGVTEKCLYS